MRVVTEKNETTAFLSLSQKDEQQQIEVAGVGKQKLFAVLMKWCNANFKDSIRVDTTLHTDTCLVSGEGMFWGSYTYHPGVPNSNFAPVNFEVLFHFEVKVCDGKYVIAINHFRPQITNVTSQDGSFRNPTSGAVTPYNQPTFETDFVKLFAAIGEQTDMAAHGLFKSVSKYIAKARNKGEL